MTQDNRGRAKNTAIFVALIAAVGAPAFNRFFPPEAKSDQTISVAYQALQEKINGMYGDIHRQYDTGKSLESRISRLEDRAMGRNSHVVRKGRKVGEELEGPPERPFSYEPLPDLHLLVDKQPD